MRTPKIFGREPVVITNMLEGLLACLLAFHALDVIGLNSPEDMAVVMAVVSSAMGLYVAYVTKDTLLGAATGFIKAGVALAAIFGWALTEQQTAGILLALAGVLAAWHRTQTGPAIVPSLNLEQHTVEVPPEGEATKTIPVVNNATGALTEKAVAQEPVNVPGSD